MTAKGSKMTKEKMIASLIETLEALENDAHTGMENYLKDEAVYNYFCGKADAYANMLANIKRNYTK